MTKQFTVQCGFAAYHANTVSVEAETLEEALEKAIETANDDPNWKSLDHCGPTHVDAYCMGRDEDPWDDEKSLPVPARFTERGEPPVVTLIGPAPARRRRGDGRHRPRCVSWTAAATRDHGGFRSTAAPRQQAGGHRPAESRRSSGHRGHAAATPSFASRVGKESTMPKPEPGNAAAFGPAISAYTRAQAIEDGILVDVSDTAREAGFTIPVAVTRSVWNRLVALPEGYRGFQDERGRLWDVLWMARHYALRASNSDRVTMCVLVRDIRKDLRDSNRAPRKHFPIVAIGAGDAGEPVITIMFPEDD